MYKTTLVRLCPRNVNNNSMGDFNEISKNIPNFYDHNATSDSSTSLRDSTFEQSVQREIEKLSDKEVEVKKQLNKENPPDNIYETLVQITKAKKLLAFIVEQMQKCWQNIASNFR